MEYDRDAIKRIREGKGLSHAEFGLPLDMRAQQIQRLEQGIGYPNVQTLLKIANTYKLSMDEFFIDQPS